MSIFAKIRVNTFKNSKSLKTFWYFYLTFNYYYVETLQ